MKTAGLACLARSPLRHRMLLVLLSLTFTLQAKLPAALAEAPYRLAVIIPLSGPVASLGEYVRKGILLAHEHLAPLERRSIELIFEDDQFDPKQTLSVYQRLSAEKPLDGVFVVASPPANALAPLTERQRQLLLSIGGSDPAIVAGRRYTFIHWVTPPMLGKKLAEEMTRRDFKKIAFVSAEVTGAIADSKATVDALAGAGRADRIVYDQTFEKSVTDYRAAISAIKSKHADAVVLTLFPGALSAFAKQAKQLELDAEIIGMETFEDEAEVAASNGALVGAWYVNASDPGGDFVSLYKKAYGAHPGWAAGNAFDSVNLLATAVRQGGKDPEAIRQFWSSVKDYKGAAGTYSSSGDNRFLLPASLKRVTTNGFVLIEKSDQ